MNFRRLPLIVLILLLFCSGIARGQSAPSVELEGLVHQAFLETHDGYSVDETLIRLDRYTAFQDRCRALAEAQALALPDLKPDQKRLCAQTLLRLRKTGKLGKVATKRATPPGPDAPAKAQYRFAVEIAARQIQAQHGAHTDEILMDLNLRAEFCQTARSVTGELPGLTDAMLIRDALALRKSRLLRPELVARIADWGKTLQIHQLADIQKATDTLPTAPGVYIFRDATGYLYIGEAKNLRTRLKQHLNDSDRTLLADYLSQHADTKTVQLEIHAFDPKSNARLVAYRRAYESDLIAIRQPRFNIRP